VFVANHASYLDAVALLAEFRFVAKRELASRPLIGMVIRKLACLTVERGDFSRSVADTERVTATLRDAASLLVFPEGTFVRAPGLLPFKLGAFKAAVEAGRPVVPVAIRGTREVLPDGRWVPRPGAIVVEIGAPIQPRASGWPEMVGLRDLARAAIARCLGDHPSDGPASGS
jgi:1-acyl-sn-glycerol-3-phosphate acyltransferase